MDSLKGKAKLAYEAFAKIEQGKKLIKEGEIELSALIPEGKLEILPVIAAKMIKRSRLGKNQSNRRSPRPMKAVCDLVLKKLDEHPQGLTSHWFKKELGLNYTRMYNIKNQLVSDGKIAIIDDGPAQKLVKIRLDKKK